MSNAKSLTQNSILENRILIYSLIFSILMHIFLLARFSYNTVRYTKKNTKPIEVVYEKIKSQPKAKTAQKEEKAKELQTIKEEKLQDAKNLLRKDSSFSPAVRDIKKATDQIKLSEKGAQLDRPTVERRITVPALKSEKINNPVYLNYYQLVRNRIKDEAYKNYSEYDSGQVYLTFVLFSNGTLKQIKLIEEKTNANSYLRNVGLKSIRDSNPFPPFPDNLKYPELSFNVVISFEIH